MWIKIVVAIAFLLAIPYASVFEWTFHRYVMHRKFRFFTYPHAAHLKHHRLFGIDETYFLQRVEDKKTLPMEWWGGPGLILLGTSPFIILTSPLVYFGLWQYAAAVCGPVALVLTIYYGLYEFVHQTIHTPKDNWWQRSMLFRRLNAHHFLHHAHWGRNLNAVLPFADWWFGTLWTRPGRDHPIHRNHPLTQAARANAILVVVKAPPRATAQR